MVHYITELTYVDTTKGHGQERLGRFTITTVPYIILLLSIHMKSAEQSSIHTIDMHKHIIIYTKAVFISGANH